MPTVIHGCRASEEVLKGSEWLTEEELAVYVGEYTRTGFQGWYRIKTGAGWEDDCALFHGKQIEVPAMLVAGTRAAVVKQKISMRKDGGLCVDRGSGPLGAAGERRRGRPGTTSFPAENEKLVCIFVG
ncbi:hypothetical protein C8F01DRAFT_755115 [Mycena amicta]|nr:hypothetical protein C8F01DRAFT_755115 [Mycena amicta]